MCVCVCVCVYLCHLWTCTLLMNIVIRYLSSLPMCVCVCVCVCVCARVHFLTASIGLKAVVS